jgi:hypothetical protein
MPEGIEGKSQNPGTLEPFCFGVAREIFPAGFFSGRDAGQLEFDAPLN